MKRLHGNTPFNILLLAICVILGGPTLARAACQPGYTSRGIYCIAPGFHDCGGGASCPNGKSCGPNNTCPSNGPNEPGGSGPICGPGNPPPPGYLPQRCDANMACSPNGLICYDPSTTYYCGSFPCGKALHYQANSPCGPCSAHSAKREQLKDAPADKPTVTVLSHYMHGIDEVPATHVSNDWICPGGFPLLIDDNDHGHLCRPAETKHCPFKARSYACLPGYSCNNTLYTGKSQEECRK
jgi:hypothetical protein